MNRYLENPRRKKIGYQTVKRGDNEWYIFSHQPITPGGPRGVWQIGFARLRDAQRVYIFFTCPHCGEIQRDLAEHASLQRVQAAQAANKIGLEENAIRWCHRCRFCHQKVPYTLDDAAAGLEQFLYLENERKEAQRAARKAARRAAARAAAGIT